MALTLSFLGGAGTVTGSRYLVENDSRRLLVDCGLFQGYKALRLRNWAPMPLAAKEVDAVLLTHAHLDHSGALPLLVKQGFHGPIHCTPATAKLCGVMLPDSGYLQEEEAAYANRHGFSKHQPAEPLYTKADAEAVMEHLKPVALRKPLLLGGGMEAELHRAGHILGAASVWLCAEGRTIAFSGDVGRPLDPVMRPPAAPEAADYLVVESTYGDRRHDLADPQTALAEVINRTAKRGGIVVIPAFAVGRTQLVLYHLQRLKAARAIPDIPVFLNSPLATNATRIFSEHAGETRLTPQECAEVCGVAQIVNDADESRRLNSRKGPMVVISASGMATGGRVLHHLKAFAPDPRNTILFTGFQAGGTRGEAMVNGAREVKIHGLMVPVNAEVAVLHALSAHADQEELLAWMASFPAPPRRTFITHGEPAAADALRHAIIQRLGWTVEVPEHLSRHPLD